MRKISKFFLIVLFCSAVTTQAQNKFAVLLGVNDYYIQPGVKHPKSLHGCVNDANAIKELLLNRFLLPPTNIYTLFDSSVTKVAVTKLLYQVLEKCHPGDAVVFYYSGHGAWMKNDWQADSVKKKMSQSMVMSNLYAPNLDCLMTDEDMKTLFNKFVDKKVIVTSILDCCYSGKMMMMPRHDYWAALPIHFMERSINLNDITYLPEAKQPAGCAVDATGKIVDSSDADGDGILDCADWQLNTPAYQPVDSLGVAKDTLAADEYIMQTKTDARFAVLPSDGGNSASHQLLTRSFNLADALKVDFHPTSPRPTDRKGSAFVSMAAATDRQLAAEISDENGIRHGAFTKALLTVYNDHPASYPLDSLLTAITKLMQQQKYSQTPTYYYEKSRTGGNLLGLRHTKLSDVITMRCTGINSGIVTLDKGAFAGMAKGNILMRINRSPKKEIVLKAVSEAASTAEDKSNSIKKGDVFKRVNNFAVTDPVVKLFVPEVPFTAAGFETFFSKIIKPQVGQANYADYNFTAIDELQNIQQYTGAGTTMVYRNDNLLGIQRKVYNILLLPVPSYISSPLKRLIEKDPNIQLVSKADDADYILFLNYAKAANNEPAGFYFYYHPPLQRGIDDYAIFSYYHFNVPTLSASPTDLQRLCGELYILSAKTERYKTTGWLNNKQKK